MRRGLFALALLLALAVTLPLSAQKIGGASLYSIAKAQIIGKAGVDVDPSVIANANAVLSKKDRESVDFTAYDVESVPIQNVAVVEEVIDDDEPFVKVEQMPSFMGGDLMTFRNWVMRQVRYPQVAIENNITGRVLLTFVIEKDGRLSNVKVLQNPHESLSNEAVRIIKESPMWAPGKQRGQAVRVKYTLPVEFRLQM